MAENQKTKEASAKDEMQIAVGQEASLRKVELDLDDAPFLKEQEAPLPEAQDDAPLQVTTEAPAPSKKKSFCSSRARRPCWCCW